MQNKRKHTHKKLLDGMLRVLNKKNKGEIDGFS